MEAKHITIVIIALAIVSIFAIVFEKSPEVIKEIEYVSNSDTIYVTNDSIIAKYINENITLKEKNDSIKSINDSINEALFVANYKLARIKRYNEIAAKGNNIKYLRGWINRVIND